LPVQVTYRYAIRPRWRTAAVVCTRKVAGRSETIATGQIVKGVKPADLPVVQSTKFEFVINTRHDFLGVRFHRLTRARR
jgi:hypothetical protein